jgi:hypothetical protein
MKFKSNLFGFLFLGMTMIAKAQTPAYLPTNGLLAWLPFDNNSSDVSGNNNNAVNNNVTFIDDRNGIPNAAGSFNGIDAWLEIATPSFTFASTDSFTYSFWINKDVQPAAGIVMMMGSNVAGNFISLIQGASQMSYGTNKQQSAWINITCPHTLFVWDHYVATYDAGIMNFYKNGVFQSTGTFTYTNVLSANLPMYIGKGFGGGNFKGGIDDVGIWGRALSLPEINEVYTNTVTSEKNLNNDIHYSLSPNITDDIIYLKSSTNETSQNNFSIYDANGAKISEGKIVLNNQPINVAGLSKGVYFISIADERNTRLKFVKL